MATQPLGPLELALAGALVIGAGLLSLWLRLGVGRELLVSALRAALQLLLLGLALSWVFALERPAAVGLLGLAMATLAGVEAVRRTEHRVRGQLLASTAVVLASSFAVTAYALAVALPAERWLEPRYAVPILGMLLGNALNGIALGMDALLSGLVREREVVEVLLAHGATRAEATGDLRRRAVRTGLIPIVNAMVAAGLISIPGMMTGQILAGEDPLSAATYQVFILFLIAGTVAAGTLGVVAASTRLAFDERDRLRADRIRPRS